MALLNSIFESNSLKELLKVSADFYIKEAIESLSDFFAGGTPTLHEICDITIEYCNANNILHDDSVYLMTSPNGKQYAGQTANLNERMRRYRQNRGSNPHWRRALKLYTFDAFKIEHYSIPTICADIIEKFMILWYDLMNCEKGYNKQSGGKNGWMISDEIRAKISASKRGVPLSENHKAALRASWTYERKVLFKMSWSGENHPMFGKKHCETALTKRIGQDHPSFGKKRPEHSKKMSGENNPNFGKFGEDHNCFGKKRTDISEINSKKLGDKNPSAQPVVVNGTLYSYVGGASKTEFPDKNPGYVSTFIKTYKKSTKMFKISKEFYADCLRKNIIENITREMHENYYYFV